MQSMLILALFVSACSDGNNGTKKHLTAEPVKQTLAVPAFSLRIALSDGAKQALAARGEKILGSIHFDGDGTPLAGTKSTPYRDVYLGKHTFELIQAGTIQIGDASISRAAFSRLSDAEYHFTINIYSSRQHGENNLLDCTSPVGRIGSLAAETITITCTHLPAHVFSKARRGISIDTVG